MEENIFIVILKILVLTVIVYITLLSLTFVFIEEISYTIGFWVYPIVSAFISILIDLIISNKIDNL